MDRAAYIQTLDLAANQFRLSLQVKLCAHRGELPQNLIGMTFGHFHLSGDALVLKADEIPLASAALEHCATFMLAVTVDTALENTIPDRFNGHAAMAARIARVIRNAFAHDPFYPRWNLSNANYRGQFQIPDVMTVDTTNLNGKPVEWQHYGGPLALLRFVRHCQQLIADAV